MSDRPDQTQSATGLIIGCALGTVAFGFFWLAYVDAPLGRRATDLLAVGAFACVLSVALAFAAREAALNPLPGRERRPLRLRRSALAVLLVGLWLIVSSCLVTITAQGQDSDEDEEATSTQL